MRLLSCLFACVCVQDMESAKKTRDWQHQDQISTLTRDLSEMQVQLQQITSAEEEISAQLQRLTRRVQEGEEYIAFLEQVAATTEGYPWSVERNRTCGSAVLDSKGSCNSDDHNLLGFNLQAENASPTVFGNRKNNLETRAFETSAALRPATPPLKQPDEVQVAEWLAIKSDTHAKHSALSPRTEEGSRVFAACYGLGKLAAHTFSKWAHFKPISTAGAGPCGLSDGGEPMKDTDVRVRESGGGSLSEGEGGDAEQKCVSACGSDDDNDMIVFLSVEDALFQCGTSTRQEQSFSACGSCREAPQTLSSPVSEVILGETQAILSPVEAPIVYGVATQEGLEGRHWLAGRDGQQDEGEEAKKEKLRTLAREGRVASPRTPKTAGKGRGWECKRAKDVAALQRQIRELTAEKRILEAAKRKEDEDRAGAGKKERSGGCGSFNHARTPLRIRQSPASDYPNGRALIAL
jgi:hypothetical protein